MPIIYLKNIFFVLITSFLYTPILLAQNSSTNTSDDTLYRKIKPIQKTFKMNDYKKGDIDCYVSPIALIEPRPTFYIGIEYFIKDNISIYTDFGYMFNLTNRQLLQDSELQNLQSIGSVGPTILDFSTPSYTIKPEIRWYTKRSNPHDGIYYGLKLMWRSAHYQKTQITFEEYAYSTLTNNWTGIGSQQIERYFVRRNSIGVQFVMGNKESEFGKGIGNMYGGLGLRYIANKPLQKRYNPFDNGNELLEDLNLGFLDFSKQSKVITIDFALGVRFGGKIKR